MTIQYFKTGQFVEFNASYSGNGEWRTGVITSHIGLGFYGVKALNSAKEQFFRADELRRIYSPKVTHKPLSEAEKWEV